MAAAGCARRRRTARRGGRATFYVEIDRVLREALSERLGTELGGLRLDELGALLRARGLPADADDRRGRRARGLRRGAVRAWRRGEPIRRRWPRCWRGPEQLIDAIERAPLGEEARS